MTYNVFGGTLNLTQSINRSADGIKGVPAERNEKQYDCCPEVYIDITFTVSIQRRKLYYIFNLVVPCLMMSCPAISRSLLSLSLLVLNPSCSRARTARLSMMSCLSLLVFSMPPDAGEKITCGT